MTVQLTELLQSLPIDVIGAAERAGSAVGRLEVVAERGGPALEGALLLRQVVAVAGGGQESALALLLGDHSAATRELSAIHSVLREARPRQLDAEALFSALDPVGPALSERSRESVAEVIAHHAHSPPLVRAALAFGAVVSSAPATRETLRFAALASNLMLTSGGITSRTRVAPVQLDASTRSAAVQVERSGAWLEWIRAWSLLLAREAGLLERAVRDALGRLAAELAAARLIHRVGATDSLVLAHLQSVETFSIPGAVRALGLSAPTVGTSIERLAASGVATELTGQKRDRIWVSTALLELAAGR